MLLVVLITAVVAVKALRPQEDPVHASVRNALQQALLEDDDREVRGVSARSLGRIGDRQATEALLRAYQKDDTILTEVVQALKDLGITPADLHAIDESHRRERSPWLRDLRNFVLHFSFLDAVRFVFLWAAMLSIGSLLFTLFRSVAKRNRSFLASLWRSVLSGAGTFVTVSAAALILYGVVRHYRPDAGSPEPRVSELAIVELARTTKDFGSVPWLIEVLRDRERPVIVRWHAAQALGAIGDTRAVGALQAALTDDETPVRMYSGWAMGNLYASSEKQKEPELDTHALDAKAAERVESAIALRPNSGALFLQRARIRMAAGHYDAALADLDWAAALSSLVRVDALLERAWILHLQGKDAEAVASFDSAIQQTPKLALAFFRRGLCQGQLGKYQEASNDFERSHELDPTLTDAIRERGEMLRKLGNRQAAITAFREYLQRSPAAPDRNVVEQLIRTLARDAATSR